MSETTTQMQDFLTRQAKVCHDNCEIEKDLYKELGVKRGLRDVDGVGVLAGLTNISCIQSSEMINGEKVPCEGKLFYRGYNIYELVDGFMKRGEFGFEEITYLLLFGKLPDEKQLKEFREILAQSMTLPKNFTRDVILKAPSKDIMNTLTKSILTLASYDDKASDISMENVLRQCLGLIAVFPMLAVYGYHAYNHYSNDESMYIHRPQKKLSTAENLLMMLRPDKQYTELEARVLDTGAAYGARRREQFHLHYQSRNLFRIRHLFRSGSSAFFSEGTQARWCQYQGRRDDAGYRSPCVRLD